MNVQKSQNVSFGANTKVSGFPEDTKAKIIKTLNNCGGDRFYHEVVVKEGKTFLNVSYKSDVVPLNIIGIVKILKKGRDEDGSKFIASLDKEARNVISHFLRNSRVR